MAGRRLSGPWDRLERRLDTTKTARKSRAAKVEDQEKRTYFRASRTRAALIGKLIRKLEKRMLEKEEVKATVADLIRLLQLDQELSEKKPKEIRVKWVEPGEEESASAT